MPKSKELERNRVQKLRDYGILDTQEEPLFNDIVKIAAHVFSVPVSIISFVDDERQWFKAKIGVDIAETPRAVSFCSVMIQGEGCLLVEDTTKDDRFKDNPLVAGPPGIRCYAGAPLVTPDGHKLGSVCVVDVVPRDFTKEQLNILQSLANQVIALLEQKKTNRALTSVEQSLIQSERMVSLGLMAGGIAHEINNPLAIICGRASSLREVAQSQEFVEQDLVVEFMDKIESAAYRVVKIVKSLKMFSRNSNQDPFEPCLVYDLFSETMELCNSKIKKHEINVNVEIDNELNIECRRVEISQVLINLISNAIDAIESLDERWINVSAKRIGDKVYFSIEDSGSGIPEEHRIKLFIPFYTTKEVGKGTGLGLPICKGLIESHSGDLYLDEDSPNTKFVFFIPDHKKAKTE